MADHSHLLSATHFQQEGISKPDIAVIPWGATEAHNYHLPYGTDNFLTEAFADESAKKAANHGVKITVLPIIPFGVNTGQLDIPLTINMNPSTQLIILEDILDSLLPHQINKVAIFNGHGGNDFRQIIRELQGKFPEMFICQVNWYQVIRADLIFEDTGEHAGEMETSLMMFLHPQLVSPLDQAGSGYAKEMVFQARKDGWMWAPRAWTQVTADTGIGNPSLSTPEKGKQYFEAATEKISLFYKELSVTKKLYL